MSSIKAIFVAVGSAVGIALLIVVAVLAWRIKNDLAEKRTQRDIADSVRIAGVIDDLRASLAARDSAAAQTNATFLTAKRQAYAVPVVTGGGAKADTIANRAVRACYETASAAITACQKARLTADSLPAMKDSLSAIRLRLVSRASPRWTAKGGVFYTWPDHAPMLRAESDIRVIKSFSLTAGAEAMIQKSDSTKQNWRAYAGVSIPFR